MIIACFLLFFLFFWLSIRLGSGVKVSFRLVSLSVAFVVFGLGNVESPWSKSAIVTLVVSLATSVLFVGSAVHLSFRRVN